MFYKHQCIYLYILKLLLNFHIQNYNYQFKKFKLNINFIINTNIISYSRKKIINL